MPGKGGRPPVQVFVGGADEGATAAAIDEGRGSCENRILMARSNILIDGSVYPVVESLGWQPSAGHYAKEVKLPDGRLVMAVALSARGPWRFWTAGDMVQPPSKVRGQV